MAQVIAQNQLFLGLEFGSTRIKSVLITPDGTGVSSGSFTWENRQKDGYWTYARQDVLTGMQASFARLKQDFEVRYDQKLKTLGGIGISGMMHGYIPTDKDGNWLVPFRTWRNTTASEAANRLSLAFGRYIPPRWCVAHLYQAAIDGEAHLSEVKRIFTLAGYIHYLLTGVFTVGLCEGSGMFPVKDGTYRADCMQIFRELYQQTGQTTDPADFFPPLLCAGSPAGCLTAAGAALLDTSGDLKPGIPLCPPEGDAATGMVATNCVLPGTANVSAGTSAFLMAVLSKDNGDAARDMDHVVTPDGAPVVMIHENNCTGGINAWEALFAEVATLTGGTDIDLFDKLFQESEKADADTGNLTCYPFFSAEPVVKVSEGQLQINGNAESRLTLANFMKMQLCSAIAPLAYGVRKLYSQGVTVSKVAGHGGFFKTPNVGAKLMSAALKAPVFTMQSAGEGGAYGMALLTLYLSQKENTLPAFLEGIFRNSQAATVMADQPQQDAFDTYLARYLKPLI